MKKTWLGLQDYNEIQSSQKSKVVDFINQPEIQIFGLEFDSTLTLGIRQNASNDFCANEDFGFKIIQTDRGGQATLHSLGQLVIFPMLDIKYYKIGVQKFTEILFESTRLFLENYGVKCNWRFEDPGVYTAEGKIAFCGLRIDSGVIRHGISINIKNNLELFKSFVPCGNPLQTMDSLKRQLPNNLNSLDLEDCFNRWCQCFSDVWAKYITNSEQPILAGAEETDFSLNSPQSAVINRP